MKQGCTGDLPLHQITLQQSTKLQHKPHCEEHVKGRHPFILSRISNHRMQWNQGFEHVPQHPNSNHVHVHHSTNHSGMLELCLAKLKWSPAVSHCNTHEDDVARIIPCLATVTMRLCGCVHPHPKASFFMSLQDAGIVPVKLLPARKRYSRSARPFQAAGHVPVSWLAFKYSLLSRVSAPHSAGSVPVREFASSLISCRAKDSTHSENGKCTTPHQLPAEALQLHGVQCTALLHCC